MITFAGILTRVSRGQQLENTSSDEQLRRCREYCHLRSYAIVAEKSETISGAFVLARSEFNDLLNLAADGKLQVIVVDIPDRLGRGDTIAQLEILAKLSGARVEYARPGRDTSTIEGFIQKAAEQMVSGIERMNIRRRTMEGLRATARKGNVIRSRMRPYGYTFDVQYDGRGHRTGCTLAIVECEANTVRQIYDWYLDGETTYGIAKRLTALKVPTLADIDGSQRKRLGYGEWVKTVISGIIKNPVYRGEWQYAKKEVRQYDSPDGVKRRQSYRPDSERIGVQVPAVISETTWYAAQEQIANNRKKGFKPTLHEYLLRGRLKCSRCGGSMGGRSKSAPRKDGTFSHFYRCVRNNAVYHSSRCHTRQVSGSVIESAIWNKVVEILQDDNFWTDGLKEQDAEIQATRRVIETNIAAKHALIAADREGLGRLRELYQAGGSTLAEYMADQAKAEAKTKAHLQEIAELESNLVQVKALTPQQKIVLQHWRERVRLGGNHATYKDKLEVITALSISCTYDDQAGKCQLNGRLGEHMVNITPW